MNRTFYIKIAVPLVDSFKCFSRIYPIDDHGIKALFRSVGYLFPLFIIKAAFFFPLSIDSVLWMISRGTNKMIWRFFFALWYLISAKKGRGRFFISPSRSMDRCDVTLFNHLPLSPINDRRPAAATADDDDPLSKAGNAAISIDGLLFSIYVQYLLRTKGVFRIPFTSHYITHLRSTSAYHWSSWFWNLNNKSWPINLLHWHFTLCT